MKKMVCGALIFAATAMVSASAETPETPIPSTAPHCGNHPEFTAVDISMDTRVPRTESGEPIFDKLKAYGTKTLIRYYDNELETLPTKTLHKEESDAILKTGMAIAVIYQHANNNIGKFLEPGVGRKDGERALMLAEENRQPYGTAIYFGIDDVEGDALDDMKTLYRDASGGALSDTQKRKFGLGPLGQEKAQYYENFRKYGPDQLGTADLLQVKQTMLRPVIKTYFDGIKSAFDDYAKAHGGKRYSIGMYCTGLICVYGKANNLAARYWMNPAERFKQAEYAQFLNSDDWIMVQQLPTKDCAWEPTPGGDQFEMDFNYVRKSAPDFGQWTTKRTVP